MLRFLKPMMSAIWEFSDSLEVLDLKKEIEKEKQSSKRLRKTLDGMTESCEMLKEDLSSLESARLEQVESHLRERRDLSNSIGTLSEINKALQESKNALELELAKCKATIILNDHEKSLMANLHTHLMERVNSAIAATADSYANSNRSRQPVD